MTRALFARAYAKVNLSLDVLRRREDGYHDLRMVMQTVDLCDELTLMLTDEPEFAVRSNMRFLPEGADNLAAKAARVYYEAAGRRGGMRILLHKRIPVGAGLGGGSADAAAVLRALGEKDGLGEGELLPLALQCGSDVPFCLRGGTQLAEGRGERLTPLPALPACSILLCKPPVSVSTRSVFTALTASKLTLHPDTEGLLRALSNGSAGAVSRLMFNALEETVAEKHRDVRAIHTAMIALGAAGAVMSGAGSAVAGLFLEEEMAREALSVLSAQYEETFLTRPVPAVL